MDSDGSNPTKITDKEGMYPNWSPDGKKIIFSGRRNGVWEILFISLESGHEELITNNAQQGDRPGWGAVCSVSPDGEKIVYSHIREKVLYSLDLKTREKTRLSEHGQSFTHPMYSRNGQTIAANRRLDADYDLIIASPDGKEQRVIAKNVISYSSPFWSDSGRELLFVRMINNNQEIFKIDLETGRETQLTNNSDFDAMPTWH